MFRRVELGGVPPQSFYIMAISVKPGITLRERYVVTEVIGRGGMGSIYLAEDNRLAGRITAIKEIYQGDDLSDDLREQAREQFYQEASVLARLDHPNLPKVSDFFTDQDRDYLVMDYVPGDDLKSLLDKARRKNEFLPISDILKWGEQIIDALQHLHGQDPPVIHRDIKPSNLKLTPNGLIKLVDFGLVKQMVPDEVTVTVIQGRGTAAYTPLEQYGGDTGHTDSRSDLYALGATLYHLLTNQPPPEAKQRFLRPHVLVPPRDLNPAVSGSIEQAVLWALELHPDQRPPTAGAFSEALFEGRPSILEAYSNGRFALALDTDLDRALAGITLTLLLVAIIASVG